MARNSEKAQSMLFRFRASQAQESGLLPSASQRRPKATSTVTTIPLAEKYRSQLLRELSRKLTRINDESLSDYQIRDLNDEINRLMKEKWSWERRIRELGGPNYMGASKLGVGGVVFDDAGREVSGGGKGYRYYGRAKGLPGVKELLEKAARRRVEQQSGGDGKKDGERVDVRGKELDAVYFGWGWEDDVELIKWERRKEREARTGIEALESDADEEWEELPGDAGDGLGWKLPTLGEVHEEMVQRKRRAVLDSLG